MDASTIQGYADKVWDLANVITGFAVAQMIIFLVGTATSDLFRGYVIEVRRFVFWAMLGAGAFYVLAVSGLHWWEMQVTDRNSFICVLLDAVAIGRVFLIVSFTGLGMWVVQNFKIGVAR